MKFLIISDIHAFSGDLYKSGAYGKEKPSSCNIESINKTENPILGIAECIEDKLGKIDALLCLGDLAHQAKKLPFIATWQSLIKVADQLKISSILAVTGNHDKASRETEIADLEMLNYGSVINPLFPSLDPIFNNSYYSDGVAFQDIGPTRVIGVDTCRLHGLGGDEFKKVYSIGSLSEQVIALIKKYAEDNESEYIIIMLHHHPKKIDLNFDPDEDVMEGGELLFKMLKGVNKQIYVIHGHKHMVKLSYEPSLKNDVAVLSAASLCCNPYSIRHHLSANQFHVLDLHPNGYNDLKRAEILSWEWNINSWKKSNQSYMPHVVSVGNRVETNAIIESIKKFSPEGFTSADDLFNAVPEVEFATRIQIEELNENLTFGNTIYTLVLHTNGRLKGLLREEAR